MESKAQFWRHTIGSNTIEYKATGYGVSVFSVIGDADATAYLRSIVSSITIQDSDMIVRSNELHNYLEGWGLIRKIREAKKVVDRGIASRAELAKNLNTKRVLFFPKRLAKNEDFISTFRSEVTKKEPAIKGDVLIIIKGLAERLNYVCSMDTARKILDNLIEHGIIKCSGSRNKYKFTLI